MLARNAITPRVAIVLDQANAASSTTPPYAMLTSIEHGFICSNCAAPRM